MWDDDFTTKKFQLGRVIQRDPVSDLAREFKKIDVDEPKQNYDRGRIVRTTNIDFFLNCDTMNDVQIAQHQAMEEEEEEEPEWNDVDVEKLKVEIKPLVTP